MAHGSDFALPTADRASAPALIVPGHFRTDMRRQAIQYMNDAIRLKGGVQVGLKVADKLLPKVRVLHQFAEQQGGPGRIGPTRTIGLQRKSQGIVAGRLPPD